MNAKQVIEFINEYVKERIFIRPSESFEVMVLIVFIIH